VPGVGTGGKQVPGSNTQQSARSGEGRLKIAMPNSSTKQAELARLLIDIFLAAPGTNGAFRLYRFRLEFSRSGVTFRWFLPLDL
jgi:hypothetical protein